MARIHSLKIENFRGIKKFDQVFGKSNLICLIGRGDSGKSTILEAISYVLSPSWNLNLYDSDFNEGDTTSSIVIEATLIDLPEKFLKEESFGFRIKGLDKTDGKVYEKLSEEHIPALTIRLEIDKNLEPKWTVVNERHDPISISANDRSKLNVFMTADYVDRHFSWNKGNPLYSLYKQTGSEEESNSILEAIRGAKTIIDDGVSFKKFDDVLTEVKNRASSFGIDISGASTSIDFRDISIKEGRVSLHEKNIPLRLKGKGSKRLISIAIQTALAGENGIILIDDLEQGLEPDRAQHIAQVLKENKEVQTFITTHSRDVLVELQAVDLLLMRAGSTSLTAFEDSLQGCLRNNPEAFFAEKVLVCEGATEVGVCRAVNTSLKKNDGCSATLKGVGLVDGTGSSIIEYCKGFKKAEFSVCLFCDSDATDINNKKTELKSIGVDIIDWADSRCLEEAIFALLPESLLEKILEIVPTGNNESAKILKAMAQIEQNDTVEIKREKLGQAAKKYKWFKNVTMGEALSNFIFDNYEYLATDSELKGNLDELTAWMKTNARC